MKKFKEFINEGNMLPIMLPIVLNNMNNQRRRNFEFRNHDCSGVSKFELEEKIEEFKLSNDENPHIVLKEPCLIYLHFKYFNGNKEKYIAKFKSYLGDELMLITFTNKLTKDIYSIGYEK